jgi:protein-disulfide isomerase
MMDTEKEQIAVSVDGAAPTAAQTSAEPAAGPIERLPDPTEPVLVIKRTTFNYVVIAVVFLALGVLIGVFGANRVDRANRTWVSEAISQAFSEQAGAFAALASAGRQPSLDDPTSRFSIAANSEYFLGSAEATVEIIEFGDYNCGYCGRFHRDTLPQIMETYGDRIRFVYRDYPILAESSLTAALANRCAGEQGAFWEYHDVLYANQGGFADAAAFGRFAEQLGLDSAAFNTCVEDQRYLNEVVADYREAQALGIRGTPAFFINGRPVSGAQPFPVFAGIIDEELAASSAS